LDSQISPFTNEDQRLTYVESRYGLFSTNFWWKLPDGTPKEDHIETTEMQKLNLEPLESI
jgi:hypothetical protein